MESAGAPISPDIVIPDVRLPVSTVTSLAPGGAVDLAEIVSGRAAELRLGADVLAEGTLIAVGSAHAFMVRRV
jgi:hypothetical protein